MSIDTDRQFETHIIDKVEKGEGGYFIGHDGCGLYIPDNGIEPKPGDTARYYGKGFGYPVRGVTINGKVVYYRTVEEHEQDQIAAQELRHAEKRAEFETNKAKMDADYDALPAEFRARLDRFRGNNPDFRWQHEPYEMFVCKQAVEIAKACETGDGVQAFSKKTWDEQKAQLPSLDGGHSGNTFAAACRFAYLYITEPAMVAKAHGALCPLVGCEAWGCVRVARTHATPSTSGERRG